MPFKKSITITQTWGIRQLRNGAPPKDRIQRYIDNDRNILAEKQSFTNWRNGVNHQDPNFTNLMNIGITNYMDRVQYTCSIRQFILELSNTVMPDV